MLLIEEKIKKMLLLELGILFLVLIVFIVVKTNLIQFMPQCIINKHFGILCPSCGATRCVINFINGDFEQSFKYHPIIFITIMYLIFTNALYIFNSFRKKDIVKWLYPKARFWIIFVIIILIFTVCRNISF